MSLLRITRRLANAEWSTRLCLACALVMSFLAVPVRGAVSEYEVKTGFLVNAARFVEWPAEAFADENAPIQLGVFGDDEFVAKLRSLLSDKKVQVHGRGFEVRRIATPADAKNVQMIFIANAEMKRFSQVLDVIRKLPVLTIGESDQFLDAGGMIKIFFEEYQIRFEVNSDAADKAKLVISSKFLRLAKRVKK